MWALILFVVFIFLWIGFYKRGYNGSQSLFISAACWGLGVFILTETLSLFGLLAFFPLLSGWSLILVASWFWAGLDKGFSSTADVQKTLFQWALTEKVLFIILVLIAAIKGYSALMSAPNTADAMSYHLSRVEHWIQDGTVAYYPTHILRQLYTPVWAEFALMQLKILSGGDHFSNTVQWFAGIGSWVGVASLAQLLGADRRGALLSAILAATLPMGLVQLTSTQTDYVLTFWMVGFVYLLAVVYQQRRWGQVFGTAACLGLALLTKGNAYVFAPIWLVIYALGALYARDRQRLKWLALILVGAVLFIVPYACRNTVAFGKPNWSDVPLTNATMPVPTVVSSMLGNIGQHLGTPWQQVNTSMEKGLYGLAGMLGVDLNHPDPRPNGESFVYQALSTGEDDSGNLLYFFLFMGVVLIMVLYKPSHRGTQWIYAAALTVAFIIFCRVVRYHSFSSRYHLALFVLSCPLAGAALSQVFSRWVIFPVLLLLACAVPWLLVCNEHPFFGDRSILSTTRIQQYFSERPGFIIPYTLTVQGVESLQCRDIGLIQGGDDWEYPWWVLLHRVYGQQFRLENVDVHNASSGLAYPRGAFDPCVIIARDDPRTSVVLPQGLYVRAWFIDLPLGLTSIFVKSH